MKKEYHHASHSKYLLHYQDLNPDGNYQNTLFKLYEREEGKEGEASLSGASVTQVEPDVTISHSH